MTQKEVAECLLIGSKYGEDVAAEHEEIYFSGPSEHGETEQERIDVSRLRVLGAYWDSSTDSWYLFT